MSTAKDLFALLPDVEFIDTDTGKTEENIITVYEGITNSVLYPADPVRLFLSTLAAVLSQLKAQVNHTGKMNLLRYATRLFLDHIGALVDCYRTDAVAAQTTIKFTLQEALAFNFAIPAGTRVTSDSTVYFATDTVLIIEAGSLSATVGATCMTPGTAGNGLIAGQITRLVDPLPYVVEVTNTILSEGGAEEEEDDAYRERIALAPESFSVAGPTLAYEYWARTASTTILDVDVFSPEPGTVQLCLLLTGGVIPAVNSKEIQAVQAIVSADRIRPLCDTPIVTPCTAKTFDYQLKWYITKSQEGYFSTIEKAVAEAVSDYETWQTTAIGRDANPDALIERCRAAGAWRVELEGLEYTRLTGGQVVQFVDNPARVNFAGFEDSKI
ncbi:baseplate J/gp47 family protein [Klebsiella oxytoca]|uniref:baseplate J/gp47 family protein n=1 Tax=Klebsiella oxytoca TaxID=571 RepID=UPI00254CF37C|nr:baseplate J/gp47 family protein [Klebsiella oxytoca]MEC5505854.1 baseplate J/gp47 family protein [Klebsiella oxytoca]